MDYRADMELELPPETPAADEMLVEEVISQELVNSEPQSPAETVKTEAIPVKVPEPVKAVPEPAPPVKQAVAAVPEARPLRGWFVQVGSFGQEMNARGLQNRLEAAGFQVRLQDVALGKKHAYRVLAGPYPSRTEAEKQAERLKSGQHLKGMVIEYPG
jgi:cell division septation protein DedD